ncbi:MULTISPECIES: helix-turn-helix domain-containing protein [Nocardiopsis]|nr:helix-turn-helix domain-containing protein [Nocardiopsis sinuspersici]
MTVTEPPRPGRPLHPVPHSNSPLGRFALELRQLREDAGPLSFREMSQRTRELGTPVAATSLRNALSGERVPSLEVVMAFVRVCLSLGPNDEHEALETWKERWERVTAEGVSNQSVVVTGGGNVHVNNFFRDGETAAGGDREPQTPETLASKRENIYLSVLQQKARHSEVNQWLSVVFIVVGVGIVVAGPVVALVRADAMPLLVSLFGVPFAALGAWLRWHVRRTDAALDSRIDRIEQKIEEDDTFDKVLKVANTIDDPQQRDEARRDAVRWLTTLKPVDPSVSTQALPEGEADPRGAIDQGDSKS